MIKRIGNWFLTNLSLKNLQQEGYEICKKGADIKLAFITDSSYRASDFKPRYAFKKNDLYIEVHKIKHIPNDNPLQGIGHMIIGTSFIVG